MNTVSITIPRDAFIAVYMMSNRKHGTLQGVSSDDRNRRQGWILCQKSRR
jgi:hypothetical protein